MTAPSNPLDSELELDHLLDELLVESAKSAPGPGAATPELLELRDTARRLRASTQWVPLPTGRTAVRRALLATIHQTAADHGRAVRRRTTQWLAAAGAVAAMGGVFVLGASALDILGSPSRPLYGLRLKLDAARVAVAISPKAKADVLVEVTQARVAEVTTAAAADDVTGVRRAGAALAQDAGQLRALSKALPDAGQSISGVLSRAENVAAVAREAAHLRSRGQLPAGVSMADLVVRAAGARPVSGPGGTGQPGGGLGPRGGSGSGAPGSDRRGGGSAPEGKPSNAPGSGRSGADTQRGGAQPGAEQPGKGSQSGSTPNAGPNAGGGPSSGAGQHGGGPGSSAGGSGSGGSGSQGGTSGGGSQGSGAGKGAGSDHSSGQGGSGSSGGHGGSGDKGSGGSQGGGGQSGSGGTGDKGSGGQGGSGGTGDKGSGGTGDKGNGGQGGSGGQSGGGTGDKGSGGGQGGSGGQNGGGGTGDKGSGGGQGSGSGQGGTGKGGKK